MALPGRKPKPVELKILEGNPGQRRLPRPIKAPPATARVPKDIPEEAKPFWRRLAPTLAKLGILAEIDRFSLADACLCLARITNCERDISERGELVDGERGKVKNPAVQLAREYRQAWQRWASEFGLTPSSRTRLARPETQEPDAWGDLLD